MAWGKLEDAFWNDRRLKHLGAAARDLYAYLLTNKHRNRLGCYPLDLMYAASDMSTADQPWGPEDVERVLRQLEGAHRIGWDPQQGVCYVRRWWRYNGLENANVVKRAVADLRTVPDNPHLPELLERTRAVHEEHVASCGNPKDRDRWLPLVQALEARVAQLQDQPDLFVAVRTAVDNLQQGRADANPEWLPEGLGEALTIGFLSPLPNPSGIARAPEAVAVAVAEPEPEPGRRAEQDTLPTTTGEGQAEAPLSPDPADALELLAYRYPPAGEILAGLEHPGSRAATWATLRARFLYQDDGTLADTCCKGLEFGDRMVLVAGALLEYVDQGNTAWSRPHFAGYVRRIRERDARDRATNGGRTAQGPLRVLDDMGRGVNPATGHAGRQGELEPTAEERARGLELVRAAIQAAGGMPPSGPEAPVKRPEDVQAAVDKARRQVDELRGNGANGGRK